jgi:hypothetical protein
LFYSEILEIYKEAEKKYNIPGNLSPSATFAIP